MSAASSTPLLEVRDLSVDYRVRRASGAPRTLRALSDIGFSLPRGETLAVVGESGSGKSTLAQAIMGLLPDTYGSLRFAGEELPGRGADDRRAYCRRMQMIFQDPLAALDPRMTVLDLIAEPLRELAPELPADLRLARVREQMNRVGLSESQLHRYPHEFSGGQAQRIGIARALILGPELLVADEPLSALDVSIKAQISNLLRDLQTELRLTMLFISHDLAAVRAVADRVLVLYLGRVMEIAPRDRLFARPRHPYTQALLASVPVADPAAARSRRVAALAGELPSPFSPPSGCVFRTRCPVAVARCASERPELRGENGERVACHLA